MAVLAVVKSEISKDPLRVGDFDEFIDELFDPIVSVNTRRAASKIKLLHSSEMASHLALEEVFPADSILSSRNHLHLGGEAVRRTRWGVVW